MTRTNQLIYCRRCRKNRAMKGFMCLQCGTEHKIGANGKVIEIPEETNREKK